jgi:hypothetical protein
MKPQLTQREKILSSVVGVIAFIFVNWIVIDLFQKNRKALTLGLDRQAKTLKLTQSRSPEKPLWQEREAWLAAQQPVLTNEDGASVQLLDEVKKIAAMHAVTVENPQLRPATRRPDSTVVSLEVDVRSPWKELVAFLGELQKPGLFVVLEKANLKVDAKDQTQMAGKFTIAKWYAPK